MPMPEKNNIIEIEKNNTYVYAEFDESNILKKMVVHNKNIDVKMEMKKIGKKVYINFIIMGIEIEVPHEVRDDTPEFFYRDKFETLIKDPERLYEALVRFVDRKCDYTYM